MHTYDIHIHIWKNEKIYMYIEIYVNIPAVPFEFLLSSLPLQPQETKMGSAPAPGRGAGKMRAAQQWEAQGRPQCDLAAHCWRPMGAGE